MRYVKLIIFFSTIESLYHKASLKFGITDSESVVLYSVYDMGGGCRLSGIYKESCVSKQTINSAVRKLETNGILYLENGECKGKCIKITKKSRSLIESTVARLYAAEGNTFIAWSEGEIAAHIRLMEKYTECFRWEVEKL